MKKETPAISHFYANKYISADWPAKAMFYEQTASIWHDHNFYELVLVISGKGYNKTLQRKVPIKAGSLLFLKPEDIHTYQVIGQSVMLLNLLIKLEFFEQDASMAELLRVLKTSNGFVQINPDSQIYKRLLNAMLAMKEESEMKKEFSAEVFNLLLQETLYLTVRSLSPSEAATETQKKTELIRDYIAQNLSKKPKLEELAKLTGTNTSYIARNFINITGYKFVELVNESRIQKACDLLINTDESIDEIFGKTGYKNKVYFHRAFKRITGMSPLQYRKELTKTVAVASN